MISLPSGNCVFSSSYNMKPFPGSFSVRKYIFKIKLLSPEKISVICVCVGKKNNFKCSAILCLLDFVNSVINIRNTDKDTKMGRNSVKIHTNIQIDF